MKETGLLFTPENYTKSEAGVKVQTRRLQGLEEINTTPDQWKSAQCSSRDRGIWYFAKRDGTCEYITCPYGTVGDRCYVKEACLSRANGEAFLYKRDYASPEAAGIGAMYGGWKSPLFMPKRAARLWLELTEVRVEHIRSISEEDAIAEGIELIDDSTMNPDDFTGCWKNYDPDAPEPYWNNPIDSYHSLWTSIHGPVSWTRNNWVWVLTYRKPGSTREQGWRRRP